MINLMTTGVLLLTYKQWDDRWRPHVTKCCADRGVTEFADAILQSSYVRARECRCEAAIFMHMADVLPPSRESMSE